MPADTVASLNSALEVGRQARRAGVRQLLLTHLMPGTDAEASRAAAARNFRDRIGVADRGPVIEI